jgi:hypothetical protein
MKKDNNVKTFIPSFTQSAKAALHIIGIAAAAGLIIAAYDWLVISIMGFIS